MIRQGLPVLNHIQIVAVDFVVKTTWESLTHWMQVSCTCRWSFETCTCMLQISHIRDVQHDII